MQLANLLRLRAPLCSEEVLLDQPLHDLLVHAVEGPADEHAHGAADGGEDVDEVVDLVLLRHLDPVVREAEDEEPGVRVVILCNSSGRRQT